MDTMIIEEPLLLSPAKVDAPDIDVSFDVVRFSVRNDRMTTIERQTPGKFG